MADSTSYAKYTGLSSSGGGVTSLDGLTGALTLVAGTGISITDNSPVANSITIASTSAGDVTIGAFGSTPNANGLSISGSQVLNMQPADATHPGGISIADWNTFNNKQNALTLGNITSTPTTNLVITGGTGAIIGSGVLLTLTGASLVEATSSVLTITGATNAVLGTGVSIQVKQAATAQSGYLSSTDWNTFNGKQASGNYITALTGDGTASGPGSVALTLAATQNNITSIPNLATVGTITSGTWSGTTIAVNKGGTGQVTAAAAFNALSPITTTGDMIYSPAGATSQRLAVGSTGNVLTVSGGVPTWAPPATAGTVTAVSVASANGFAGSSSGGATPALTISTSITGILQGNGTAISAATTTGSGNVVLATAPTITLANATGLPLTTGVTGILPLANGGTGSSTKPLARYFSSSTTINGGFTTINWTTKDYDTANAMSAGSYTCPIAGKYQVNTALLFTGTYVLNNQSILGIFVNGVQISGNNNYAGGAIADENVMLSDMLNCAAGDVITIRAASGATAPSIAASTVYNFVSIAWVSA